MEKLMTQFVRSVTFLTTLLIVAGCSSSAAISGVTVRLLQDDLFLNGHKKADDRGWPRVGH
jgi:hypothetical protein